MGQSFAKKTITGVAWTYLSYVLSKSSGLITTAILARLITPAEFGIIGFAVTAMVFMDAVRDLGMGLAIIQRQDRIEEAANTAFWLNMLTNFVIWIIALAIAPLVAEFFDEPLLVMVLPIMSISFMINSLGSIHDALLQREMRFSTRMIPAFFSNVVKGIISVILALLGFGVWSLVIGLLVGRTVYSIVAWLVVSWRPRFQFDRDLARELVGFGYKISVDSLLSAFQANVDYIFIGRFLGDTALGLYTIAFRVPELIIINFCTVIAHVLFPAYASLQHDRQALRLVLLDALRYIALITIPAGVGLAIISPLLVTIVFGPDWEQSGPIMAALAIYGSLLAVSWNIGDVYKAIGRVDYLWKTALLEFALLAPVLYVLAHRDAFAVSVGHVVVAFIVSLLRLLIAMHLLSLSMRQTFSQFVPAVICSMFMGGVVVGILDLTSPYPPLISLLIVIGAGTASYVLALWWVERQLILSVVSIVSTRLGAKSDVPVANITE